MDKYNGITYLVLDYNRPECLTNVLVSIKKHTLFEHQVYVLSNGGSQDYIYNLYKSNYIDKLFLFKENKGLGIGTLELFEACRSKYAIYCQNDQLLVRDFPQSDIDMMIGCMENDPKIRAIGLAGNICGANVYSERAHFIDVEFYKSIPNKPIGGVGPFANLPWIEGYIQKFFHDNGYKFPFLIPQAFVDIGLLSIRENTDGTVWVHRVDTKEVWLLNGIPKTKFCHPPLNEEEFLDAQNGKWPTWVGQVTIDNIQCPGRIPVAWLPHSFDYLKGEQPK